MSAPAAGWERRVEVVLGVAASLILLAMMLLTFVDVVARYVVNRPVRGAFEVTELMLLVLIFAGLPLVSFTDEHALMDFIDRLLGPRAQRWLERAVQAALRGAHAPARLDGLAQGRPDLGLPRRDRRAAHRVRPVRVLHGGDDRAGRGDPPLQAGELARAGARR